MQGLDWDARYREYSAQIGAAPNLGEGFAIVAAFLSGLKDSHAFFTPPMRGAWFDSGYRYELVGNDCFIDRIRPGTDAESKLHIGNQILTLNGFRVIAVIFTILATISTLLLHRRLSNLTCVRRRETNARSS